MGGKGGVGDAVASARDTLTGRTKRRTCANAARRPGTGAGRMHIQAGNLADDHPNRDRPRGFVTPPPLVAGAV